MSGPPAAAGEVRVLVALFVQPLVAALLAAVMFLLVELTGRPLYGGRPADMVDGAIAFALGVSVTAAAVTLLGVCPLLLWLLRHGPVRRRHALLSGLLLGNAPAAIVILVRAVSNVGTTGAGGPLDAMYGPLGAVRIGIFGSAMGLMLACAFYGICGDLLAANPGITDET